MKVAYHPYKQVTLNPTDRFRDEDLLDISGERAKEILENKYSFVAMTYHPGRKRILVGATHAGGDILLTFDPATRTFESCGFGASPHFTPSTNKIHKGLSLDLENDEVYFGIATLARVNRLVGRPGGALLKYSLREGAFTLIDRPVLGQFFQATLVDPGRKLMYFVTGRDCFGVYDLARRRLNVLEPMESVPHNLAMDDRGGVWGTHTRGEQAFFRYNPDADRFDFPDGCVFPNAREAADVMYPGAGPVDAALNGGDGFMYMASALGELYRLDPEQGTIEYLGKPFPGRRLPALALGADGWLYMAGGCERASLLARYHRGERRFECLGPVKAPDGTFLNYAHELCIVDGVCYIGETDNKTRSGYMWSCEV